jgi:hypothetical protein
MSHSIHITTIIICLGTHLAIHASDEKKSDLKRALSPVSVSRSTLPTALTVSIDPTGTAPFKHMRDYDKKKFAQLYKGLQKNDLLIKIKFTDRRQSQRLLSSTEFPTYMPAYLFKELKQKNKDSITFTLDGQIITARLAQGPSKRSNLATPTSNTPMMIQRPLGKEFNPPKLFEEIFKESIDKAYEAQIKADDPCCSDCIIM